jgi:trehalose/maltose hydrolase-like predicted phosphorylase
MTGTARPAAEAIQNSAALARRFEAIVFGWDGTAVRDRRSDAERVRRLVEQAIALGLELVIVSDAEVGRIDRHLAARPAGPGGLVLALNYGSEVFLVDREGPKLAFRRTPTKDERVALSRAAELTVKRLRSRGLQARVVSEGPNRRKIDLVPDREPEDPPKGVIAGLLGVVEARLAAAGIEGLQEVVMIASGSAVEAGLADPRVSCDGKYVEIGLTDTSDSSRWITHRLWERGIAPDQVLVVGDEFGPIGGLPGSDSLLLIDEVEDATAVSVGVEPGGVPAGVAWLGGGPDAFATLLEDQVTRRRRGELPVLSESPGWVVTVEGIEPLLERARESLLTLADGRLGTRGGVAVENRRGNPTVLMSGVYTRTGAEAHLLAGPRWNLIAVKDPALRPLRRVLDLRTGVVRQRLVSSSGPLEVLMFSSLARPGTAVLRASGAVEKEHRARALEPPPEATYEQGEVDGCVWMSIRGRPGSIAAAAHDRRQGLGSGVVLDRVAAYEGVVQGAADPRPALGRLRRAREVGFDGLLCEHRRRWASRWADSDVTIDGDLELQRAVRFALFHLMANVGEEGEAAVGARGLSGGAYRGHVFWDSDVYVLPFLAATHPPAARAMLEYRIRRLPAAIRIAHAQRRAGARFPWESAWSGRDVTPDRARAPHGETVPILTGELEEHIVADVAWAAACYIDWTGDQSFARGPGCELLVQTARWWASRIEPDGQGRGHIRGVIGPDEYHGPVDDNAFTNVMARWNLRRAADASAEAVGEDERRRWRGLADTVVDGYDPETRVYEQFAGFHALEPLLIADVAPQRPVAADVLLGHERTRSAQVIKQADVLMLHYLVPDEAASGSLEPNLEFYEPRTAHGSTLSPGVHAALLARAGRPQDALEMLRLIARIDLDDIGHMTAGGLHLAAMGGVWRALAFGFAGLRPVGGALAIDPMIAPWKTLELRLRFRGSRVLVRIHPGAVDASADPPLNALSPHGERVELTPSAQTFKISPSRLRSD